MRRVVCILLLFGALPARAAVREIEYPGEKRLAPPEVPVPDAPELFWLRIVAGRPGSEAVTVRRDLAYTRDARLDAEGGAVPGQERAVA